MMKLIPGDEEEEEGGGYLLRVKMNMKKPEKSSFLQGVGYRVRDGWKV